MLLINLYTAYKPHISFHLTHLIPANKFLLMFVLFSAEEKSQVEEASFNEGNSHQMDKLKEPKSLYCDFCLGTAEHNKKTVCLLRKIFNFCWLYVVQQFLNYLIEIL